MNYKSRIMKFVIIFIPFSLIIFCTKVSRSETEEHIKNIVQNFEITKVEQNREEICWSEVGVTYKKMAPKDGYSFLIIQYLLKDIKSAIVIDKNDFVLIDGEGNILHGYIKVMSLSCWFPFSDVELEPKKDREGAMLFTVKSKNIAKYQIRFFNVIFPLKQYMDLK